MKVIACWNDLREFGFDLLTGEACGLMYRLLFDVTRPGKQIVEKCLGLSKLTLPEPWNRGDENNPPVGSILLTRQMPHPSDAGTRWSKR